MTPEQAMLIAKALTAIYDAIADYDDMLHGRVTLEEIDPLPRMQEPILRVQHMANNLSRFPAK